MSEQARFQAWWESTGTNSVILRAQAWSAWLARAEAEQPQPDPHIALMEAEHDDRMQPQPAEDPDEWVIQDKVPPRFVLDQWKWVGHDERTNDVAWKSEDGKFTRYKHGDEAHGETLHVRCRRRDLPKVEQVKSGSGSVDSFSAWKREQFCKAFGIEQAKQCISHDEHRGEWRCKNAALPGKDHCSECETTSDGSINWSYHEKQKPQPQKKMLRLWIDSDCNIHAGLKGDGDLELHYDHETRQFYTEEQS